MGESRIRKRGVRATPLVIESERVGSGERHRYTTIDSEWHRPAQARHHQPILAWHVEGAEVRFVNLLVRRGAVGVTRVGPLCQRALVDIGTGVSIHQLEAG